MLLPELKELFLKKAQKYGINFFPNENKYTIISNDEKDNFSFCIGRMGIIDDFIKIPANSKENYSDKEFDWDNIHGLFIYIQRLYREQEAERAKKELSEDSWGNIFLKVLQSEKIKYDPDSKKYSLSGSTDEKKVDVTVSCKDGVYSGTGAYKNILGEVYLILKEMYKIQTRKEMEEQQRKLMGALSARKNDLVRQ